MIQKYVDSFITNEQVLKAKLATQHWGSYKELLDLTLSIIINPDDHETLDVTNIREIDDGDYQGTLLFIIAEKGYQPHTYYATKVWYGSCSGCDTLQSINGYRGGLPSEEEVHSYYTLCLHMIQSLKEI